MPLSFEDRPWGRWEEHLNEPGYRVKRLIINPKKRLSLQSHALRSEYWVVVQGEGKFNLDGREECISRGDSLHVPIESVHRVSNTTTEPLVLIETQLGVCMEDDIIRYEDDFNRVKKQKKIKSKVA